VIFVNGCFWHGHGCHLFKWPKTEAQFWQRKIAGNIRRDVVVRAQLREAGWRIAEIWECALKGRERLSPDRVLAEVDAFLRKDEKSLVIGADQRVRIPDATWTGSSAGSLPAASDGGCDFR